MLRNYMIVALRNLLRHRVYSAVNLGGLAVGMACCLLILLYVRFELSYDDFHENGDRIYRVAMVASHDEEAATRRQRVRGRSSGGDRDWRVSLELPLAQSFARRPEVERAVIVHDIARGRLVSRKDKHLYQHVVQVGPSFFEMFSFPILRGDSAGPLEGPGSAVITETTARQYFGTGPAVGETITLDRNATYVIAAVTVDPPPNSHLQFDVLVPFSPALWMDSWSARAGGLMAYLQLRPDADIDRLLDEQGALFASQKRSGEQVVLQPLSDVHTLTGVSDAPNKGNPLQRVLILSTLGLVVLVLACINYVNLSMAQSMRRIEEVGVRRALGARGPQLVRQFLCESVILTAVGGALALGLAAAAHPWFANLTQTRMPLSLSGVTVAGWLALAVGIGLAAGIYPSLFAGGSGRRGPMGTARHRGASSGLVLRRSLIVVQFVVSAGLICGTVLVARQLDYLLTKDLGFDREANLVLPVLGHTRTSYETVKAEVASYPGVQHTTAGKQVFVGGSWASSAYAGHTGSDDQFYVEIFAVDHDFVDHFGLDLLAGHPIRSRFVAPAFKADMRRTEAPERAIIECVINETLAHRMGFSAPADALGAELVTGMAFSGTVVGVTRDFHFRSLYEPVSPVAMVYAPSQFRNVVAKVQMGKVQELLPELEALWKRLAPDVPFTYWFLEDRLEANYASDMRTRDIVMSTSVLALVIACTGLFGLTAFVTETRTREIGIRKALGASVARILSVIGREFVLLVAAANVISWPLVYWTSQQWLNNFAYRIEVEWWLFGLAGAISVLIAAVTVNSQVVRVALTNPVEALRYE